MAAQADAIVTEFVDSIAIVRFNKPTERNPLSVQTLHELNGVLDELEEVAGLHKMIFTGTEDIFASGANIRELATLQADSARKFSRLGQDLMDRISAAAPFTIAAVNGYCMGGALDLALACDIRIASTSAVFAHPGAKLGIITGWGGTQRLPRLVGRTRSLELLLTAGIIDSKEALRIGLVTRVCDPVVEHAIAM